MLIGVQGLDGARAEPSLVRDLVICVFKLKGQLVETGNGLVGSIGLTTALWQVLDALGYAPGPLPVADIARNMGLTRQSVQRVVDLLAARGLVRFDANPRHRRAKLAALTDDGRAALTTAELAERPQNQLIFDQLGSKRIAEAIATLTEVAETLSQSYHVRSAAPTRKDQQ